MGSRILLADDSITIQKVVNLTFADEGIEVVAVSNGDMAERRLSDVNPDLVLADIFMPGKNGYELCEAIKESAEFRNVPVVLLVGAFEPFDQAEARRVRADAHLTKPFESRTLVETVRRLISASSQAAPTPVAATPERESARESEVRPTRPLPSPVVAAPPMSFDFTARPDDASLADQPVMLEGAENPVTARTFVAPSMEDEALPELSARETATATLTETSDGFDTIEFGSESDSRSEFGTGGAFLDFDKPDSLGSPVPVMSFQPDEGGTLQADASAVTNDNTGWIGAGGQPAQSLDPSRDEASWQPAMITPSSYEDAASFGFQSVADPDTAASFAPAATLLGVEEPLGDVFQNENLPADTAPFGDVLSSDSLGFDFAEPAEVQPLGSSSQFDVMDVRADAPVQEPHSIAEEVPVTEIAAVDVSATLVDERTYPATDAPANEEVSPQHADDPDWTSPNARVNSTAQLESLIMPIGAVETTGVVVDSGEPETEASTEAAFETNPMQSEETAYFTPIDAEAVEVKSSPVVNAGVETGFSFTPVPEQQPAAVFEGQQAEAAAPGAETHESNGLSTAAIEEIVRRVVLQMSESVVREVAWEVVPDCVERVINQLTREALAKRM